MCERMQMYNIVLIVLPTHYEGLPAFHNLVFRVKTSLYMCPKVSEEYGPPSSNYMKRSCIIELYVSCVQYIANQMGV
jgi:hypothetical protein